ERAMKDAPLCVLCGVNVATKGKGDHLPPQCLYPRPRKPNVTLNTVPACFSCNGEGSRDDEVFKMFIGLSTGDYRDEAQAVVESLAGTMKGNLRLRRDLLTHGRRVIVESEGGGYKEMMAVRFCREAYEKVITRMVRGLFWQRTGQILEQKALIKVAHGAEL